MFEVELTQRAQHGLAQMPEPYRQTMLQRLLSLRSWPNHQADVRSLRGSPAGSYRLRVGPYRAIRAALGGERRIVVIRVGHRRSVYR